MILDLPTDQLAIKVIAVARMKNVFSPKGHRPTQNPTI